MLALLFVLLALPAQAAERLAVLYFDANGIGEELEPLGRGIADMLITDLQSAEDIQVVERRKLAEILRELDLQASGYVDEDTAVEVGKGLGADLLVSGAITTAVEGMRIDARLIDVQTGEVREAVSAAGAPEDFFELEHRVAQKLLRALGSDAQPALRDLSLDQALAASRRIEEMETQYVARLTNVKQYMNRRWRRKDLSFTTGSNGQVSTVKTWAIYDGGESIIAPRTAAERVNDTDALAKMQKHKRIGGGLLWGSVIGGGTLCAATGVYGLTGPDPYAVQIGSPTFERRQARRNTAFVGCLVGLVAILPAYVGAQIQMRQRFPVNYWTPDEADELLDRANSELAEELGLSERDRREADLRE